MSLGSTQLVKDSRPAARLPVSRSDGLRGCWWGRCRSRDIGCSAWRGRCLLGRGALPVAPTKSGAFDAFVLADWLRHEHRHWRSLAVPSALLAELRALTRDRERLICNQRDVENQLRGIVQTYQPAVLHLFSSLDRISRWGSC